MPKTELPKDNEYMENSSYLYSAHSLEVTIRMGYNNYLFKIVTCSNVCRLFADPLLYDSIGI